MILFEVFVVVLWLSHVRLFATLWTVACQALLSMGFSRQEYWSGLPFPSPGYLLDPEIKTVSPASPALQAYFFFFLTSELPGKPWFILKYLDTVQILSLLCQCEFRLESRECPIWGNASSLEVMCQSGDKEEEA